MSIGGDATQAVGPSLQGWPGAAASAATSQVKLLGAKDPTNGTLGQGQAGGTQSTRSQDGLNLSPEAQQQIAKLKARDQHVRAHEAAHSAAGGSLVRGAATYSYQQGPDGRRYAVGGEVSLDTSAVPGDPRATMAKAERIRAAALAPSDPSGQDRSVAAQAAAMESQASQELAKSQAAGNSGAAGKTVGAKIDLMA